MQVQTSMRQTLSEQCMNEFLQKARRMEHDVHALLNGEEIITYFTIDSFEKAREVIGNATPEQLKKRQSTFFNESLLSRARLGQGKHDRGEAVVFAGMPVTEADAKGINRHFPVHVKGISVLYKHVKKGETWDVSVLGEVWGLDEMEELYTCVNVGTLVLEKGAKLVVRGNVSVILCQQLICEPELSPLGYHIGILPTPFSVDFGHGPLHGVHGVHGENGINGKPGAAITPNYGILGPWIPDDCDAGQLNATNGTDGMHGTNGSKGRNGGMCKLSDITIRNIEGHLSVFSQAGTGGNGGDGGNGGNGGTGGQGAPGIKGFNGELAAGANGMDGHGGSGGGGGNAGHGGLSSNIYLNVPNEVVTQVSMSSCDSVGGIGGGGGRGGCGASNGPHGKPGLNGRSRPAAHLYLNDDPYTQLNLSPKL